MKSCRLIAMAALATAWINGFGTATATHPDLLRHYEFLPDRSTLNISRSWSEAPDIPFIVSGTFDIAFFASHDEFISGTAQFVNVDAFASHPFLDMAPLNLDKVLNLSGLKGHQLPVAAPFDVYKFEGRTDDGSAVDLFARLIGPGVYLDGKTTPPADDWRHDVYELRSVARELTFADADFNQDGAVDREDLRLWASSYGATAMGGAITAPSGDADGDRDVDGADFLTWQRQVSGSTSAASDAFAAAPVPEPASLALAAIGLALWMKRRR